MMNRRIFPRGVKVFAGFMMAMMVCTVVSRAADSVLVAWVEVEKPSRGSLSYTYEGTGRLVPIRENRIFLWPDQQVEYTAAAGGEVKKGECLIQFRMEYLEKKIAEKRAELKQLRLHVSQQQVAARESARVPAADSAWMTLSEAERNLQRAEETLNEAYADLEQFLNAQSEEDEVKEQELKSAVEAAEAAAESARQEEAQARNAYELAIREDEAVEKNEADTREAALLAIQETQVQMRMVKKELKELKSYKRAGGKICAREDCAVLENNILAGTITAGTEVIVTGCGGWKLQGEITDDSKNKIKAGDEAEIRLNVGGKQTVKIDTVEKKDVSDEMQNQENTEGSISYWYAEMPEYIQTENKAAFSWKVQTVSEQEYEQTIPLSALREGTGETYCLVLSESEYMLGTVQVAKKVPVTVLEKDSEKAAVTSTLTNTDEIIKSSEKYVKEGDRVRIKE